MARPGNALALLTLPSSHDSACRVKDHARRSREFILVLKVLETRSFGSEGQDEAVHGSSVE